MKGLERIARLFVHTRGSRRHWLEPACGSGRYLRVLARRGYHVTGFDQSPAMIDFARRRAPEARLLVADLADFVAPARPQRFDFAFNLHNSIRHLESDAAMLAHFAAMARALRPGGVYAVGLSLTGYGREPIEEDVWEGRRGGLRVRQVVQYLPPGTWPAPTGRSGRFERVVSHLLIERGSKLRHLHCAYDMRCYDGAQWRRLVARSALRTLATVTWKGDRLAARIAPYAIELLSARAALGGETTPR